MTISKRALIAGVAVSAIGMATVGGVGLASAATADTGVAGTSIVDKLVSKFNLNKDEVEAVFDEDRTEHRAEMKQRQAERLAQAVADGELTQEQADHITRTQAEITALMDDAAPDEQDESVREQIKAKLDALRSWAKENNVEMRLVGPGGHGGPGGPGGGGQRPDVNDSSTDN